MHTSSLSVGNGSTPIFPLVQVMLDNVLELNFNKNNNMTDMPLLNEQKSSILYQTLVYSFAIPLIFLTAVGNGIILITIKFQARLLSSTSNYFILSLSLADFLVGIVIMPIMLVYTANDQLWTNSMVLCDGWMSFDFLCSSASFLTLSAMSIERYKMLTTSYVHIRHSSKMRIIVFILLSWLLPSITWIPTVLFTRLFSHGTPNAHVCSLPANKYLILALCVLLYHVPLVCMATFYTKLIMHIKSSLAANLDASPGDFTSFSGTNNNNNNNNNFSQNSVNGKQRQMAYNQQQSICSNSMSDSSPRHNNVNLNKGNLQRNRSLPPTDSFRTKKQQSKPRPNSMVKSNSMNINYAVAGGEFAIKNQKRVSIGLKTGASRDGVLPKLIQFVTCCRKSDQKNESYNRASLNSAMYIQSLYNNTNNKVVKPVRVVNEELLTRSFVNSPVLKAKKNSSQNEVSNQDGSDQVAQQNSHNNPEHQSKHVFDASKVNFFVDDVAAVAVVNKAEKENLSTRKRSSRFSVLSSKKKDSMLDANDIKGLRYKRNRKAARMLGLLVAAFSFCWLPFAIGYPLSQFFPNLFPGYLNIVIWWLGYINSTINPFLYVYSNKNIRRSVRILFCERLRAFFMGEAANNARFRNDSFKNLNKQQRQLFEHENEVFVNNGNQLVYGLRKNGPRRLNLRT